MIFDNRKTAGHLLGEWLKEKLGKEGNYIVLGIPRGGVRALGKRAPAPQLAGWGRSIGISASERGEEDGAVTPHHHEGIVAVGYAPEGVTQVS
jgi:hypothetical protein